MAAELRTKRSRPSAASWLSAASCLLASWIRAGMRPSEKTIRRRFGSLTRPSDAPASRLLTPREPEATMLRLAYPQRATAGSDAAGAAVSAAGRRRQPLQASQQSPLILGRNLLQCGRQSDQVQNAVL